jgi:hypothetical protein
MPTTGSKGGFVCCFICRKEMSLFGLTSHIWRMHGKGVSFKPAERTIPWNKGLTIENEKVRALVEAAARARTGSKAGPPSEETKKKIGDTRKRLGLGNQGGGRGIKGRYQGIWCDSSWELAWVIYQLEHGVPFERNRERFGYLDRNEVVHFYTPDFKLADGSLVEIKGFVVDKDIL